jgi:predicted Zn-dependent protease
MLNVFGKGKIKMENNEYMNIAYNLKKVIAHMPGEVFFKFKHDSKDGRKGFIEAIKKGNVINLKTTEIDEVSQ